MAYRPTHIGRFAPPPPVQAEDSVKTLVQRLVTEGKDYVSAEIDVYKTKATIKGKEFGTAAGLAVGALILADAALIALLVGLILTLDRAGLGPGAATAIVVVVTLIIAGVLGLIAYGQVKKAMGTRP
jgi:hypothetical protein